MEKQKGKFIYWHNWIYEIHLVREAVNRGEIAKFDKEIVEEMEARVPSAEFSPEDVPSLFFNPKENSHGLGYNRLKDSGNEKLRFLISFI